MHRVYLETFGCQMNELDSELVRGHLAALGYRFTRDSDEADIVLYNTCSVREQAENKVCSRIGLIGREKARTGREVILGVLGCMAEREGPAMMNRFPQIDLMCGPGELDKLPMLLENAMKTGPRGPVALADRIALQGRSARRSQTLHAAEDDLEMLDLSRAFDPDGRPAGGKAAYVRITRGCNKFCTYCVVPNTRGPEVHRPPDAIIEECRRLADAGVIEVTLLGQTVNHYIYTHGAAVTVDGREAPQVGPGLSAWRYSGSPGRQSAPDRKRIGRASGSESRGARTTTFADLLKRIHDEVPALQRLRFLTSFPLHFGDDVLQVMAGCPRICRYLHVPAQSGSNRILKLMNRGYTREEYLEFIGRVREHLPDAEIAGDVIVGFPTETEEDFEQSQSLLHQVRFKNNFIFKYSPRPGTAAMKRFADDVPDEVKRRRNNELLALQAQISAEVHAAYIGRTVDVFVERATGKGGAARRAASGNGATKLTVSANGRAGGAAETQRHEGTKAPRHEEERHVKTSTHQPGNTALLHGPPRSTVVSALIESRSSAACGLRPLPVGEGRGGGRGPQTRCIAFGVPSGEAASGIQVSGRTGGDLITVFDLSDESAAKHLIGRIVPVRVTDARPLLLVGKLIG